MPNATAETQLSTRHTQHLFRIVYLLMFLYGIQATVLGVVLPRLIRHYATTAGAGGFLVTAQTIGGFIILLIVILAAKRVSGKLPMLLAYLLIGATSIVIALSTRYVTVALIFIILGAGMRLFDASSNSFIGEYAVERRNRSMNLLHTCFAGGAIIGPVIAQLLLNLTTQWTTVYLAMGLISFMATVPLVTMHFIDRNTVTRSDALPRGSSAKPSDIAAIEPMSDDSLANRAGTICSPSPKLAFLRLFADPTLSLISLTLALYAIHQSSLTAWLPHLLETTGKFSSESGIGISVYWIGIFLGRIAATKLPDTADRMLAIAIGAILGAISTTAAIVFTSVPGVVLVLLLIAGASSGALIPLSFSAGQAKYPDQTTSITALFSLFLLIGRFAGPWGIGMVSDMASIKSSLYITAAVLVLCAITAALSRTVKGKKTNG